MEPQSLRFLRRLVTVLTAVMIAGVLLIVVLLVIRLRATGPEFPSSITLPAGFSAETYTQGRGWYAVSDGDRILIFDQMSGAVLQDIAVKPTP